MFHGGDELTITHLRTLEPRLKLCGGGCCFSRQERNRPHFRAPELGVSLTVTFCGRNTFLSRWDNQLLDQYARRLVGELYWREIWWHDKHVEIIPIAGLRGGARSILKKSKTTVQSTGTYPYKGTKGSIAYPCLKAWAGKACDCPEARPCQWQRDHPNVRRDDFDRATSQGRADPGPRGRPDAREKNRVSRDAAYQSLIKTYPEGGRPCTRAFMGQDCTCKPDRKVWCAKQKLSPGVYVPEPIERKVRQQHTASSSSDEPEVKPRATESKEDKPAVIATDLEALYVGLCGGLVLNKQIRPSPELIALLTAAVIQPFSGVEGFRMHVCTAALKRAGIFPTCCVTPQCQGLVGLNPFHGVPELPPLTTLFLNDPGPNVELLTQLGDAVLAAPDRDTKAYFQFRERRGALRSLHAFAIMLLDREKDYAVAMPVSRVLPSALFAYALSSQLRHLYPNFICCPFSCGKECMFFQKINALRAVPAPDPKPWDNVHIVQNNSHTDLLPRIAVPHISLEPMIALFLLVAVALMNLWLQLLHFDVLFWITVSAIGYCLSHHAWTVVRLVDGSGITDKSVELQHQVERVMEDKHDVYFAAPVGFQKEKEMFFAPKIREAVIEKCSWLHYRLRWLVERRHPHGDLHYPKTVALLQLFFRFPGLFTTILMFPFTPWALLGWYGSLLAVLSYLGAALWQNSQKPTRCMFDLVTLMSACSPEIMLSGQSPQSYLIEVENLTRKLASILIPACTNLGLKGADSIVNHTKDIAYVCFQARKYREDSLGYLKAIAPARSGALTWALQAMATGFGLKSLESLFQIFYSCCAAGIIPLITLALTQTIHHGFAMTFFLPLLVLVSTVLLILVVTHRLLSALSLELSTDLVEPFRLWLRQVSASSEGLSRITGALATSIDWIATTWTSISGCLRRRTPMLSEPLLSSSGLESSRDIFGYRFPGIPRGAFLLRGSARSGLLPREVLDAPMPNELSSAPSRSQDGTSAITICESIPSLRTSSIMNENRPASSTDV